MPNPCEDLENIVGTDTTPAFGVSVALTNSVACAASLGFYLHVPVVNTVALTTVATHNYSASIVNTVGTATTAVVSTKVRQIVEDAVALSEAHDFRITPPLFIDTVGTATVLGISRTISILDSVALATTATPTRRMAIAVADAIAVFSALGTGSSAALVDSVATATVVARFAHVTGAVTDSVATATVVGQAKILVTSLTDIVALATVVGHQATTRAAVIDLVSTLTTPYFRSPDQLGWQMNTETTALSKNTNFDFDSVGQLGSSIFGVAPDGIYLFGADTDDGVKIPARMETGFLQFGSSHIKHLLGIYFGYRGKRLKLFVETYGRTQTNREYTMVDRNLAAPAPNRIVTGKGTASRYWRFTFTNVDGEDFEVSEMEADVSESTRRL